jgi:hypothetical protein
MGLIIFLIILKNIDLTLMSDKFGLEKVKDKKILQFRQNYRCEN